MSKSGEAHFSRGRERKKKKNWKWSRGPVYRATGRGHKAATYIGEEGRTRAMNGRVFLSRLGSRGEVRRRTERERLISGRP